MTNNKTVFLLKISKSRILSFLDKSLKSPTTLGFSSPTHSKRLFVSFTQKLSSKKKKNKPSTRKKIALFVTNETVDPVPQNTEMDLDNEPSIIKTKPPPPIFIRTVNDFSKFCARIKEITKGENFSSKSSISGIKLSTIAQLNRIES